MFRPQAATRPRPDNSSRRATHYHPAATTLRGGLVLLHAVLDSTMCRIYAWRGVSRGAGSARQPCVCAACCGAARRRGAHSSCDLPTRLPRTRILSSLSRHSNQSNRFTMAAKFVVIFVACVALTHGAMVRRDAPPDALAEIEKHAKEFQKTLSDQFTALMNSKNTQDFNKAIKEGSESVVSQLTAFSNSLQGALADANGKAKDALEQAHKNIQHTVEELRKAHPDVEKEANAVKEKLQAAMQSTVQETQKLAKEVAGNLDETNKKLAPQIKSAYDSFVQQVEAVQKKLHEAATKQ